MSTFAIIAGCIVGVSIALLLLLVYTIGHMRGACGRCSICKERFAARSRYDPNFIAPNVCPRCGNFKSYGGDCSHEFHWRAAGMSESEQRCDWYGEGSEFTAPMGFATLAAFFDA